MASVLITGASKGIGFETALAFGRAGHRVHATMRNPPRSPELAQKAERERLPITVSAMDVDSDQSVGHAIAAIHADHGPIDVLVNNAGIERAGSVEELPLADFRAVMETNYFGAIRCIQALAPHMRQRQSGCIVNVTSISGRITNPPLTAYSSSKWALEALSEALAGEMKTFGVRVVIVEPGIIDTAMARRIGGRPGRFALPAACPFRVSFQGISEQSGTTVSGRREDRGDCGERDLAASSPGWTGRRSLRAVAPSNDGRGVGGI